MPRRGRKKRMMNQGQNSPGGSALALKGPPGATFVGTRKPPKHPPPFVSNLVVRKNFRFVLGSSVAEGTTYSISAAKLCALISIGTVLNSTVVQMFEAVRIRKIRMWSSVTQTSGTFAPKTIAMEFSGTGNGIQGPNIKISDMSVGATEVARLQYVPSINTQPAQWQNGSSNSPPLMFTVTAGGGAVIDLELDLTVTADTRATNNSTAVSTAVLGQIYYLAMDNNCGGNLSTSNNWSPMAELITTT